MKSKITKEQLEQELKVLSKQEIADKYGYTVESLRNKINKLGIISTKNFTLKHDYFQHESHSMYYILGILAADGSVHNKRNYICLDIAIKDRCLLEFVKNEINKNQKILEYSALEKRYNKIHKSCKLCFYSKQMKTDLINLGIVPNKTKIGLNINIDSISDLYFYDFLRGYFDGDGCISHKNVGNNKYKISSMVCSDRNFLVKIQNRIDLRSSIQKERTYYNLIYNHYSSLILRDLLYKNVEKSFCLERKREKFYA